MKQVDKLILKEMSGPWVFGAAIFTCLILAGSCFYKLTQYLVDGIPSFTVMQLFALLVPGVVAKTLCMAMLLSTLLAFGRLSRESEIVALQASGISVLRMMRSVLLFSVGVGLLVLIINEFVVPPAAYRATQIQTDIIKSLSSTKVRPEAYPLYDKNRLVALVSARDFNVAESTLGGATIVTYGHNGEPANILLAKSLTFSNQKWELPFGADLLSADGRSYLRINEYIWPEGVPKISFTPQDLISRKLVDLDSLSMKQIQEQLKSAKKDPYFSPSQRRNLEYGWWNKIALPMTAIVFGLLGAPLGIRGTRSSVSSGFWISVLILFSYIILTNVMALNAKGGIIAPNIASFLPIIIGIVFAGIIILRKNR